MGLEGYGIEKGAFADFNLLQAKDSIEAIRLRAHRLRVVRRGKIIARNAPLSSEMDLPGRPTIIDPSSFAPKS